MAQEELRILRKALDESKYTVVLGGSGLLEESGYLVLKNPDKAYDIERKYGVSPEYIYSSAYFNTRTDQFFEFYKNEMINVDLEPNESDKALAAMEAAGKLQCMITSNIFELPQRGGVKNVINLHGSVYHNVCPHCRKEYPLEYMRAAKRVPHCDKCNSVIRPMVSLFGEMVDSQVMTKTTEEIEKAEVLLLLGTSMESRVFKNYIRYFNGKTLAIIHKEPHYSDRKADIIIYGTPREILPQLGY
ncbi:Sir2 family NAD-dependent protein deacetylase [Clostridium sp. AM58-1XD]|uniref:SIR2 family NAD-dependent protein deacylase n=1 Tax=Clostridium sp. AM58-1XD TaxID=2292307 RepID=UPI000E51A774|nr:Sir2 family NAD-dependent protein deacetylase [Clostridium sp. AM58-1XD]RGZ00078.1 NAD-dependent deacetylase [Clostridium sp. AM58-1XD]